MRIIILSGSSRTQSLTERCALALANTLSQLPDVRANIIFLNQHNIPFVQDGWSQEGDMPEKLRPLWNTMETADAFILVSPEYNGSYSAALKNFMDHFPKRIYSRKPMGIVTASPGSLGGIRAAVQMQQMICAFFGIPCPLMLTIPFLEKKIDPKGDISDTDTLKQVSRFTEEILWMTSKLSSSSH